MSFGFRQYFQTSIGAVAKSLVGALTFAAVFAAIAQPASAEVFEATTTDPAGDGQSAVVDLRGAAVAFDNSTGKIDYAVKLGADYDDSVFLLSTGVGTLDSSGACNSPLVAVGSALPDGNVIWVRDNDGQLPAEFVGDADVSLDGSQITYSAAAPELKGFSPNCGEVVLSNPETEATYDTTTPFKVAPRPKVARLGVRIGGVPSQLKRNAARTVKVTVKNSGDGVASGVKVSLAAKGSAKLKPRLRKAGRIGAGKSSTFKFRLKVGKKAKGKIKLKARASAKGVKAVTAARTIRVKLPRRGPTGPVNPSGKGLKGKLFWTFEDLLWDRSPETVGLYFSNSKFVHWGIPKGGLVNCHRVTAKVKDGELQPGCVRYSYNKRTGKIRIRGEKGTYRRGKLKLKLDSDLWRTDGDSWYPSAFAKPGARFKLTLINRSFWGACGVSPYCSTSSDTVTLDRKGMFGRTESSLTTSGGGVLPFIAIGSYPPEDRGHYKVMSSGRIRFAYADGKVETETLTIQTNKRGKPDPVNEGILLDDKWFYREDD